MDLGKVYKKKAVPVLTNGMILPEMIVAISKRDTGVLYLGRNPIKRILVGFIDVRTGQTLKEVEHFLDLQYEKQTSQDW